VIVKHIAIDILFPKTNAIIFISHVAIPSNKFDVIVWMQKKILYAHIFFRYLFSTEIMLGNDDIYIWMNKCWLRSTSTTTKAACNMRKYVFVCVNARCTYIYFPVNSRDRRRIVVVSFFIFDHGYFLLLHVMRQTTNKKKVKCRHVLFLIKNNKDKNRINAFTITMKITIDIFNIEKKTGAMESLKIYTPTLKSHLLWLEGQTIRSYENRERMHHRKCEDTQLCLFDDIWKKLSDILMITTFIICTFITINIFFFLFFFYLS